MENVLFSIIIPVYNMEDYLRQAVETILPQMQSLYQRSELLLIDDGSTDSSPTLCDEYAAIYPDLVRTFHKGNEGLLLTRRFGFRQAKGKYIINCDSDDTLDPDTLQILTKVAEETDADVIIYNISSWDGNVQTPFSKNMFESAQPDKESVLRAFFHCAGAVSMCGKSFKRSCLDIDRDYSGYYKKSFGEDTLQSAEIYTNAISFVYIDKALYNYRCDSGMTGKMNPTYFQDFTTINSSLELYKPLWQLDDFDALLAQKVFINAARAITQSRFDKSMTAKNRQVFMSAIRESEILRKYEDWYPQVSPVIKRSYRVLLDNLLKGHYSFIDLTLRIKNLLSR